MEYFSAGELYDLVERKGAMDEAAARHCFRQILLGAAHLHRHGVAHRDLSLENVLLDSSGRCVLIDLGMCLRLPVSCDPADADRRVLVASQGVYGKRNYIAPEILEGSKPFDAIKVDVWALGIMLFIMLTGVPPFEAASPVNTAYRMICAGHTAEVLEEWNIRVSSSALDLIGRILRADPEERPSISQILAHEWMMDDRAVRGVPGILRKWSRQLFQYEVSSLSLPPS